MIIELLENKKNFTNAELQITAYILLNPFEFLHMTATELGEKTYTSKATVFRLCKKIGIKSYDELKRQVDREMHEKKRLNSLLEQEPFQKNSSIQDIIRILPSFYDVAISNTKLTFDTDTLTRVVEKINVARTINIYATGITESCANTAMFKFLSIGKECSVYGALNEHYLLTVHKEKMVAILLSFKGNNPGIIHIAKYLKQLGIYTVGIGGLKSDQLKKICDEYIEIYQKKLVLSLEVMTPYISMTYIFDVLFASLLVKNYDECLENAIKLHTIDHV